MSFVAYIMIIKKNYLTIFKAKVMKSLDAHANRQASLEWKITNEISGRKKSNKAKLKIKITT